MKRPFNLLLGILICVSLFACSPAESHPQATLAPNPTIPSLPNQPPETETPQLATSPTMNPPALDAGERLQKTEYQFSLVLPSGWLVVEDSFQSMLLAKEQDKNWSPASPSNIPEDPRIRILVGNTIRERLGPNNFPQNISPAILRQWIAQNPQNGGTQKFSERNIQDILAYETTEISVPGCEEVIYWRMSDLQQLVRLSTGCQSPYLDQFTQLANSLASAPSTP